MVEKIVYDYLKKALDVPVYLMIPPDPPGRFVTVEKTGISVTDHIETSTLAIQSWGDSEILDAIRLDEKVRKAMREIVSLPDVSACYINASANFTDTASKRPRYQSVFLIVKNEEA